MKKIKILTLILFSHFLHGQSTTSPEDVIHKFFQAMATIDTGYLNNIISDEATLSSTMIGEDKTGKVSAIPKSAFINSIAKSLPGELDERVSNFNTNIDDGLANVWMDYSFYYKGSLSHCGVNNFTLAYIGDQWKIISLADSRRLSNCTFQNEKIAIENLLDDWHLAATNADSDTYFNLMTTNSIFIGTDKTEVWTKDEFMAFAAPYFEKGKAWDFKRVSRNVYSDDFEKTAWFDELLDTWMGPCRGSGVLVKENGEWRIEHYVLSVTVPNEEIQSFLRIYDK